MTHMHSSELSVNGEPPDLTGQICEAFLCEAHLHAGEVISSANVSYLKFDGSWHRVYFDCGIVFWRSQSEPPTDYEMPEHSSSCQITDVGRAAGVVGQSLDAYSMISTLTGSRITFRYTSGRQVVLEDSGDVTSFAVI